MRKVNLKQKENLETPNAGPIPPIPNMDEKKENIVIDEVIEQKLLGKKTYKTLNLDDNKKLKKKKEYTLDDTIIREIYLGGNINMQLLSNINGYFVDIRKYFNGYPTRRGIRMLASKFTTACEFMKDDLNLLTKASQVNK